MAPRISDQTLEPPWPALAVPESIWEPAPSTDWSDGGLLGDMSGVGSRGGQLCLLRRPGDIFGACVAVEAMSVVAAPCVQSYLAILGIAAGGGGLWRRQRSW